MATEYPQRDFFDPEAATEEEWRTFRESEKLTNPDIDDPLAGYDPETGLPMASPEHTSAALTQEQPYKHVDMFTEAYHQVAIGSLSLGGAIWKIGEKALDWTGASDPNEVDSFANHARDFAKQAFDDAAKHQPYLGDDSSNKWFGTVFQATPSLLPALATGGVVGRTGKAGTTLAGAGAAGGGAAVQRLPLSAGLKLAQLANSGLYRGATSVTLGTAAQMGVGGMQSFGMMTQQAENHLYNTYRENGLSHEDALNSASSNAQAPALIAGVITAGLIGTFGKFFGHGAEGLGMMTHAEVKRAYLGGMYRVIGRNATGEMLEEGADEVAQGFIEQKMWNPEKTEEEIWMGAMMAAFAGGILGGTVSAITARDEVTHGKRLAATKAREEWIKEKEKWVGADADTTLAAVEGLGMAALPYTGGSQEAGWEIDKRKPTPRESVDTATEEATGATEGTEPKADPLTPVAVSTEAAPAAETTGDSLVDEVVGGKYTAPEADTTTEAAPEAAPTPEAGPTSELSGNFTPAGKAKAEAAIAASDNTVTAEKVNALKGAGKGGKITAPQITKLVKENPVTEAAPEAAPEATPEATPEAAPEAAAAPTPAPSSKLTPDEQKEKVLAGEVSDLEDAVNKRNSILKNIGNQPEGRGYNPEAMKNNLAEKQAALEAKREELKAHRAAMGSPEAAPEAAPEPAATETKLATTDASGRPVGSWVVVDKSTGKAVLETSDKEVAERVDTSKFDVVPALEHLEGLNKKAKPEEKPKPAAKEKPAKKEEKPKPAAKEKPAKKEEKPKPDSREMPGSEDVPTTEPAEDHGDDYVEIGEMVVYTGAEGVNNNSREVRLVLGMLRKHMQTLVDVFGKHFDGAVDIRLNNDPWLEGGIGIHVDTENGDFTTIHINVAVFSHYIDSPRFGKSVDENFETILDEELDHLVADYGFFKQWEKEGGEKAVGPWYNYLSAIYSDIYKNMSEEQRKRTMAVYYSRESLAGMDVNALIKDEHATGMDMIEAAAFRKEIAAEYIRRRHQMRRHKWRRGKTTEDGWGKVDRSLGQYWQTVKDLYTDFTGKEYAGWGETDMNRAVERKVRIAEEFIKEGGALPTKKKSKKTRKPRKRRKGSAPGEDDYTVGKHFPGLQDRIAKRKAPSGKPKRPKRKKRGGAHAPTRQRHKAKDYTPKPHTLAEPPLDKELGNAILDPYTTRPGGMDKTGDEWAAEVRDRIVEYVENAPGQHNPIHLTPGRQAEALDYMHQRVMNKAAAYAATKGDLSRFSLLKVMNSFLNDYIKTRATLGKEMGKQKMSLADMSDYQKARAKRLGAYALTTPEIAELTVEANQALEDMDDSMARYEETVEALEEWEQRERDAKDAGEELTLEEYEILDELREGVEKWNTLQIEAEEKYTYAVAQEKAGRYKTISLDKPIEGDEGEVELTWADLIASDPDSGHHNFEKSAQHAQLISRIQESIELLPSTTKGGGKQKQVIQNYLEGFGYEEMAREYNVHVNTIKNWESKAKANLLAHWVEMGWASKDTWRFSYFRALKQWRDSRQYGRPREVKLKKGETFPRGGRLEESEERFRTEVETSKEAAAAMRRMQFEKSSQATAPAAKLEAELQQRHESWPSLAPEKPAQEGAQTRELTAEEQKRLAEAPPSGPLSQEGQVYPEATGTEPVVYGKAEPPTERTGREGRWVSRSSAPDAEWDAQVKTAADVVGVRPDQETIQAILVGGIKEWIATELSPEQLAEVINGGDWYHGSHRDVGVEGYKAGGPSGESWLGKAGGPKIFLSPSKEYALRFAPSGDQVEELRVNLARVLDGDSPAFNKNGNPTKEMEQVLKKAASYASKGGTRQMYSDNLEQLRGIVREGVTLGSDWASRSGSRVSGKSEPVRGWLRGGFGRFFVGHCRYAG